MTSIGLPLSTDLVTPSYKATSLVSQDLPLMKPCWLSQITSLSSLSLSIAFRRICSTIFPGTEVRLTSQSFPGPCFLPFLKMGAVFPFYAPVHHSYIQKVCLLCLGFSQNRVDFHKMPGGHTARQADPNWPNNAGHLIPWDIMLSSGWASWPGGS